MTLFQAIPHMNLGKRIRRKCWGTGDYIELVDGELRRPMHDDDFIIGPSAYMSDDWEISPVPQEMVAQYVYRTKSFNTMIVTDNAYIDDESFLLDHPTMIHEFKRLLEYSRDKGVKDG